MESEKLDYQKANKYLKNQGFTIGNEIEKGYYGVVFKVTKEKTLFACKYVEKISLDDEEVKISQLVDHINVIKTHSVHINHKYSLMIMDFANGGDLYTDIRNYGDIYDESLMKIWWKQILIGLKYLHTICNVAHRDLKCENILVFYKNSDRGCAVLKICDFNESIQVAEVGDKMVNDEKWQVNEIYGTPEYMAPEVLSLEMHDCRASDRWSLAVILFLMKKYVFPFGKYIPENKQNFIQKQKSNEWRNKIFTATTSSNLIEIFRELFNPNWRERINFDAIEIHAWLLS